jgi:WD40 repeat protein
MKQCPDCKRSYDDSQFFCLVDGKPLIVEAKTGVKPKTEAAPARKNNSLLLIIAGIVVLAVLGTASWFFLSRSIRSGNGGNNSRNSRAAANTEPKSSPSVTPVESGTPEEQAVPADTEAKILNGHTKPVNSVSYSPDGKFLVSGAADGTIKLWDTATGDLKQTHEETGGNVTAATFSPDGKVLAIGVVGDEGAGFVKVLKFEGGAIGTAVGTTQQSNINALAISSDGRRIAIGSVSGIVKLTNLTGGGDEINLEGQNVQTRALAFSPDGKALAGGGFGTTVKLWNIETGVMKELSGHTSEILAVAFSPDGKTIASGGMDNTLILWDVAPLTSKQTITGNDSVSAVAFSPNGSLVAAAVNRRVEILDASGGDLKQTMKTDDASANCVAFSRDGKTVAAGYGDGSVRLWVVR